MNNYIVARFLQILDTRLSSLLWQIWTTWILMRLDWKKLAPQIADQQLRLWINQPLERHQPLPHIVNRIRSRRAHRSASWWPAGYEYFHRDQTEIWKQLPIPEFFQRDTEISEFSHCVRSRFGWSTVQAYHQNLIKHIRYSLSCSLQFLLRKAEPWATEPFRFLCTPYQHIKRHQGDVKPI